MKINNRERVGRGLDLLAEGLTPFVESRLKEAYDDGWEEQVRSRLRFGSIKAERGGGSDPQKLLSAMWNFWHEVFSKDLAPSNRNLVKDLQDVRNRWAHHESFTLEDTYRALGSMERLLHAVSSPAAVELRSYKEEVIRLIFEESGWGAEERRNMEEEWRRQEESVRRALAEEKARIELERQSLAEEKRQLEETRRALKEKEKRQNEEQHPRTASKADPSDDISIESVIGEHGTGSQQTDIRHPPSEGGAPSLVSDDHRASQVQITEPTLLIRINRNYRHGMSAEALYDVTRGVWKVGPRRGWAQYVMAVYGGVVREVYVVKAWYPAGATHYVTCDVEDMRVPGRWEFVGRPAHKDVREKYLKESVAHYFKHGQQNPVVYVNCPHLPPTNFGSEEERAAFKRKEGTWDDEVIRAIGGLGQEAYIGPLSEKYGIRAKQVEKKNRRRHIPLWENLEEAVKVYELILASGEVLRNSQLGGRLALPAQLAFRLYEEGLVAQAEIGEDPMRNGEDDRLYARLVEPHTVEEVRAYIRQMVEKNQFF